MMGHDTLIIIPAYNEEASIAKTISDLKIKEFPVDIAVINDGSRDCTAEIAAFQEVLLISHPYNLGYGAAVQTGFKFAISRHYQYVIQFDADGQHDPADLQPILEVLHQEAIDLVIGSRYLGDGTIRMSKSKMLAIRMIRILIKLFTGKKISDPTSGLKGVSRALFGYYAGMGHYPFDFPDADVLLHTLQNGYQVKEIPVRMHCRIAGNSMYSGWKPFYYIIRLFVAMVIVLLQRKTPQKGCEVLHG